jgi:hypothetical protein
MLKLSILVGVRGSWVASVATVRSPKTGFRHRLVGVQTVQLHDDSPWGHHHAAPASVSPDDVVDKMELRQDDEAVRKGGNDPPETGPTPPVPPVSALD